METLIDYAKTIGSDVISIHEEKFIAVPKEFRWLADYKPVFLDRLLKKGIAIITLK